MLGYQAGRNLEAATLLDKNQSLSKLINSFVFRMNEQDLHLAKAMVRMDLQESPKTPRKTVVGKVQEKLQNFR